MPEKMLCEDVACPRYFDEDSECQQIVEDCVEYDQGLLTAMLEEEISGV